VYKSDFCKADDSQIVRDAKECIRSLVKKIEFISNLPDFLRNNPLKIIDKNAKEEIISAFRLLKKAAVTGNFNTAAKTVRDALTRYFNFNVVSVKVVDDKYPNAWTVVSAHEPDEIKTPRDIPINFFIVYTSKIIQILEPEELVAVTLHEIGHTYYTRFMRLAMIMKSIPTIIFVIPLVLFAPSISFVGGALTFAIDSIASLFERKNELKADSFAVECGFGRELAHALVKLEKEAKRVYEQELRKRNIIARFFIRLIRLAKKPYNLIFGTHPSTGKRIENIKDLMLSIVTNKEARREIEKELNKLKREVER
jgi:Zn-dependent protease with chaperone function